MYIALEENEIINLDEIIGIFDIDRTTVKKRARDYINGVQRADDIITLGFDLPRSFIVKYNNKVILSKLLPATIKNRVIKYEKN